MLSTAFSRPNTGNGRLVDAKGSGSLGTRDRRVAGQSYLFVGKLAVPMATSERHTTFLGGILHIVASGALKQMVWVATRRIIALVAKDDRGVRQITVVRQIRHSVGALWLVANPYDPVSIRTSMTRPLPASIRGDGYAIRNSFNQRPRLSGKVLQTSGRPHLLVMAAAQSAPDKFFGIAKMALHRGVLRLEKSLFHYDGAVNHAV